MSSTRIVLVWPWGEVLCQGFSVLGEEPKRPATAPIEREDEEEEPCPPTKPSASGSGIFRRAERAA